MRTCCRTCIWSRSVGDERAYAFCALFTPALSWDTVAPGPTFFDYVMIVCVCVCMCVCAHHVRVFVLLERVRYLSVCRQLLPGGFQYPHSVSGGPVWIDDVADNKHMQRLMHCGLLLRRRVDLINADRVSYCV